MPNSSSRPSNSLWRPLRSPTFRNLLTANVVSDIGTFMQSVGAAWLMVSLNAGPMYVALIQTASALPFVVLALPAGAVGDILDRRRIILGTESWNLKEFELLAGSDSPTGKFESIGKFHTENVRFFKDPYQPFKFPPVEARYLKVRVISSHGFSSVGAYEFQLLGALEG